MGAPAPIWKSTTRAIYAIGGRTGRSPGSGVPLNAIEAYDIEADVWMSLAPMPTPVMDTAAIAIGGKIYVIGGGDALGEPVNTVQIYNIADDTWSLGQSMPTSRANLALANCGSVIVATGGRDAFFLVSTTVEGYEIPHDQWVAPLASMPTPKSEHSSVSKGNLVYVTGSGIASPRNSHEALTCSSLFGKQK